MLERLLFPTDLSESNLKIVDCMSDFKNAGVREVGVLFVINTTKLSDVSGGFDIESYIEEKSKKADEKMGQIVKSIESKGLKVNIIRPFPTGEPVAEILNYSKYYDFIAMNSRGTSVFKEILLGSVSEGVVRSSKKPVYIFKFNTEKDTVTNLFSRILVAYDFSKYAEKALDYAKYVAKRTGSEIHLLHVAEPGCDSNNLDKVVDELADEGFAVHGYTEEGVPHKVIIRKVDEIGATTIFMGSRGIGVFKSLLLGSTSDSIIRHSHVPVFVCKVDDG